MDKRDQLLTGDVVLFSNNTPTGFMLKTFVSTDWNHSGIAVRFISTSEGKRVSLTSEGELYILETNTGSRLDIINGGQVVGAGFSEANWLFRKYNIIAVRKLRSIFRTPQLAELTVKFAQEHSGKKFPTSSLPFIQVWLGVWLRDNSPQEYFCSELMAHYYLYCIGPQYSKITNRHFDGKLKSLFGGDAPSKGQMYTPGHYDPIHTPTSSILHLEVEPIYVEYADMWYIWLQPLLLTGFIIVLIYMSLPK